MRDSTRRRTASATSVRGEETRERILGIAMLHFAELGLVGASLRDIADQSDVNLSALHYYFGSKEELFTAAAEFGFNRLSEKRLSHLRALEEANTPLTLENTLEAFIKPVLDLARTPVGLAYLRLQTVVTGPQLAHTTKFLGLVLESTAPFRTAIRNCLPDLPESDLIRGYRSVVCSVLGAVADPNYELLTGKPSLPSPRQSRALVDLLVCYHAAGLRAIAEAHVSKS